MTGHGLKNWTRAQLLALPWRDWWKTSTYDTLLLLPSGVAHYNGMGCITIIGCRQLVPTEIVTTGAADLLFEGDHRLASVDEIGASHVWANGTQFEVPPAAYGMTIHAKRTNLQGP